VRTLNLGILAHVDAGKTTLTERLLHDAGVIDELGSVDAGNTQTDSLALERRRGITIKSAVVAFTAGDVTVNLIDTPGHPDFIAEVERVLAVLDGAVLVVSAVEGVQAQTRVLMRALQRLRIPTIVFANKTDRRGADPARVLREIADKLSPAAVGWDDDRRLAEVLADHDDALLEAYVEDEAGLPRARLRGALAAQTRRARVHPVFFGSARTGAGVADLVNGITELLPAPERDGDGPPSGTVFKIERGPAGEKIAYVRMFSGAVHTRDRLGDAKVTAISVFDGGAFVRRDAVAAGEIAKLWGLADVRIGDAIGEASAVDGHWFAPPTLETVVVPRTPADRRALRGALDQLAEQDPLIGLRQDDARQEISVSLYGEVQKEVIQATLADDFGVDVTFRETTTICIERPAGSGAAFEIIDTDGNPFLATVGLRVDPAPAGSGVTFALEVELGSMPLSFFTAVEETVRATLEQGLYGWRVADCAVTMTHSGYWAKQSHSHATFDKSMSSTARDFRQLTPLVLMAALRRAGTRVLEPVHRFQLELPADALGPVLPAIAQLGGVPGSPLLDGATCRLEGDVPAARVHELRQRLPGLTRGEALLESAFDRYEPVRGAPPSRPRTDDDPLDREEYVRRVSGRRGR
jgi:ribosomal protection tetracycline resistance protein